MPPCGLHRESAASVWDQIIVLGEEARVINKRTSSRGLPVILVTGASGLVGGQFINAVKNDFFVYAIARRCQIDTDVPMHDNIHWLYCDIGDAQRVAHLFADIASETAIDYLFHFAGYYDFTNKESPEYRRTNIDGIRHVLENAEQLRLKRFIFSSSIAVTNFTAPDIMITEQSPPDAEHPYARSKREAEQLVTEFSKRFPCTIARLAAIYSDWCEYGPLYILLNTWMADTWRSRYIAGGGTTAIPYLHVQELNRFFIQIMRKHHTLGDLDVLLASPNGCVSHNDLYAAVTRYASRPHRPRHIPLWLSTLGVLGMQTLGMLSGKPSFERVWMMRYVDRTMNINAAATHRRLEWVPKPRVHVTRRLLFLIERMKNNPIVWNQKNLVMARRMVFEHSGLKIYNAMQDLKIKIITEHIAYLREGKSEKYPHYSRLNTHELHKRVELIWLILEASLRLGDRLQILTYAKHIAQERFDEGFLFEELTGALKHMAYCIESSLNNYPPIEDLRSRIHNEIVLTMQIILDEIEDVYDTLQPDDAAQTAEFLAPHDGNGA